MDYKMICSVCATPRTNKDEERCPVCGGKLVFTGIDLTRSMEMLIKRGIGVGNTYLRYLPCKTEVTINLTGYIPEHLFCDLPSNWRLQGLELISLGMAAYQLCCYKVHPDSDDDAIRARLKMAQDLEKWLEDRDVDGFKTVLILSGYDPNQ